MQRSSLFLLLALLVLAPGSSGWAVTDDYESERVRPGDADYAAGLQAFEQADWQGVIDNLGKVVARRPWDDNAHNLMGYAYRKLGDYLRALEHYQRALDLNPHHRGALEYLGEAYLEMGCAARARGLLDRLETECRRLVAAADTWRQSCKEWQALHAALDTAPARTQEACPLD